MTNKATRKLAISMMTDDNGISEESWGILKMWLASGDGNKDIINAVQATDGRFYLPEEFIYQKIEMKPDGVIIMTAPNRMVWKRKAMREVKKESENKD